MKTLQSRGAGILLHISSLPSKYGIGTFGEDAYRFVDFLKASGQSYWQVLPLGQTGYGDSPYQSFSAFAGNPYFIDLEELVKEKLVTEEELENLDFGDDPESVEYEKLFTARYQALRLAFHRSRHRLSGAYSAFLDENRYWLDDYALFMALKTRFHNAPWRDWDKDIKLREQDAMRKYQEELTDETEFWKFIQFTFITQWRALKTYANQCDIKIIGDLPIYVAIDSADTWANSELFELDGNKDPIRVAGVPPDFFSETGQLWGNPLYCWRYIDQTGYVWWKRRMRMSADLFDIIRIDHFIGFERYYAIPANNTDARAGVYEKGPSMKLIRAIQEAIPDCEIVAENLGVMTPEVDLLLEKTGYPGMNILQFAFDGCTGNTNLPFRYTPNNLVYTGTHDNDTVAGFFEKNKTDLAVAMNYLGIDNPAQLPWSLIRLAYGSVANTAMIPLQDFLELSSSARMNMPTTLGCNWRWRYKKGVLTEELAKRINAMAKTYGR